jgi:hypothetical protein
MLLALAALGLSSGAYSATRPDYGGAIEIAYAPWGLIGKHTTGETLILDLISEPLWSGSRGILGFAQRSSSATEEHLTLGLKEDVLFHDGETLGAGVLGEILLDSALPASRYHWLLGDVLNPEVTSGENQKSSSIDQPRDTEDGAYADETQVESEGFPGESSVSKEDLVPEAAPTSSEDNELMIDSFRVPELLIPGLELLRPVRGSFHTTLIGTGPFVWTAGKGHDASLAANDHHWAGRPFLDRIDLSRYATQTECEAALRAGDVGAAWLTKGTLDHAENPAFRKIDQLDVIWFLGVNSSTLPKDKPELLTSPEGRNALISALHLDELARALLGGEPTIPQAIFMPEASTSYTAISPGPFQRGPADSRVSILYPEHVFEGQVIARRVQAVLLQLGFEPKLAPVRESELEQKIELGQFDIVVAAMVPGATDPRVNLASFYSNYVAGGPFGLPDNVQATADSLYTELYFHGLTDSGTDLENLILSSAVVAPAVKMTLELWASSRYNLSPDSAAGLPDLWLMDSE